MAISLKELFSGHVISDIPISHQHNLEILLIAVNKLRSEWGKPMTVSSGYRSEQDHIRIYTSKGITDRSKIPMSSKHLFGLAVDFADPDGSLYKWAFEHQDKLAEWGIWCEAGTNGWLHCQCVQYGSYKPGSSRFFNP